MIVLRFTGEIQVNGRQLELLFKRVIPTPAEPRPTTQVPPPAPPPSQSDPFKGRLMFTIKETAEMLGLSHRSVYRLVQRQILKTSRALRHIKIPKAEIERFLKSPIHSGA